MSWRRWNSVLHRDIGFLCIGLTLLYAISGVAVNHIKEWNPSYSVERVETNIGTVVGEGRSITVDLPSGHVVHDRAIPRPVLREMNFLHLNHPKKAWTWFADLYAAALAFLAVSGLFMLSRKTMRRGLVLTGIGVIIPVFFLILYL
jgi:hypothetical protein